MVIFCTLSTKAPIEFKQPVETDYMNSGARRMFLVPRHEIDPAVFATGEGAGELLFKNATDRFLPWQQESALGHWGVMRTVLPPEIWEAW